MRKVLIFTLQISLFVLFSAAYAELISHFVPLYIFNAPIRETLFLVLAACSSLLSVGLLKNVLGLSIK